jgi:hypothetical protein
MITVSPKKILVTIKRSNGGVDVVDVAGKFCDMTPAIFARIKLETAKAGKGDVVSYEIIDGVYEMDAQEKEMAEFDKSRAAIKKAMSY